MHNVVILSQLVTVSTHLATLSVRAILKVELVSDGFGPVMKTRSRLYFQEYLLKGMQPDVKDDFMLILDSTTSHSPCRSSNFSRFISSSLWLSSETESVVSLENVAKATVTAEDPYEAFYGILDCARQIVAYFLQLYLVIRSVDSFNGGLIFSFLCLVRQIIQIKTLRYLWYESKLVLFFFAWVYSMCYE